MPRLDPLGRQNAAGAGLCLLSLSARTRSTRWRRSVDTMTNVGTINKTALAALPTAPDLGTLRLPTQGELTTAENVVEQLWPSV